MDRYVWLQLIGVTSLLSPTAMIVEACGLSWLVEDLFSGHVQVDEDKDR